MNTVNGFVGGEAYLGILLVDLAALGSAGLGSRPEAFLRGLLVPERKKQNDFSVQFWLGWSAKVFG